MATLEEDRALIKKALQELYDNNSLTPDTKRTLADRAYKCSQSNANSESANGLAHSFEMLALYLVLQK